MLGPTLKLDTIAKQLEITADEKTAALARARAKVGVNRQKDGSPVHHPLNVARRIPGRLHGSSTTRAQQIADWADEVIRWEDNRAALEREIARTDPQERELAEQRSLAHRIEYSQSLWNRPDWTVPAALCWIAFRDADSLAEREAEVADKIRHAKYYGSPVLAEPAPEQELLNALRHGKLKAWENEAELPPQAWTRTEVQTGRLHPPRPDASIRKEEVIRRWSSKNGKYGKRPRSEPGPYPSKRFAAIEAMVKDYKEKSITEKSLRNFPQRKLAEKYRCNRETACKARDSVLEKIRKEKTKPSNTNQ
jgi:hypothetical protein